MMDAMAGDLAAWTYENDREEEMNETMIVNWNRVVPTGGIVFHLGDVAFGSEETEWEKHLKGFMVR